MVSRYASALPARPLLAYSVQVDVGARPRRVLGVKGRAAEAARVAPSSCVPLGALLGNISEWKATLGRAALPREAS